MRYLQSTTHYVQIYPTLLLRIPPLSQRCHTGGPARFTCTFPVSSSSRFLLSDLDTDETGNIYLLYSGYGTSQDGKAEIWRVNTVTGESQMTQLNHSASVFTVCSDRVAVVEQTYEPGEGEEVILLGTPLIHLYEIDWDV